MLSKEEIEKAKERCDSIIEFCKNNKECQKNKICTDCYIEIEDIKAMKILLQYIDQLENQIQAKEMEHEYDVNMIDEVKGNSVKLYKEIRKQNKIIDEMAKAMYSNISMLEMAKIGQAIDYDPRKMFAGISDEEAIDCIKQYFEKKVEGK